VSIPAPGALLAATRDEAILPPSGNMTMPSKATP
jgi:hypothetical protein